MLHRLNCAYAICTILSDTEAHFATGDGQFKDEFENLRPRKTRKKDSVTYLVFLSIAGYLVHGAGISTAEHDQRSLFEL